MATIEWMIEELRKDTDNNKRIGLFKRMSEPYSGEITYDLDKSYKKLHQLLPNKEYDECVEIVDDLCIPILHDFYDATELIGLIAWYHLPYLLLDRVNKYIKDPHLLDHMNTEEIKNIIKLKQ